MSNSLGTSRGTLCLLLGVIGLAALLRGLGLGSEGLWVDEAYTAEIIRGTWSEIVGRLQADEAPPLFYFLQKLGRVFGETETTLRFLPCLAGILTVAVAMSLALSQPLRSRIRLSTFVGLTFATSTLLIFYSQQARSYSWVHLLELSLLASTLALRQGRENRIWPWPTLWVASALALLYSHNLAVWPVLAALLFWAPRFAANLRTTGLILAATTLGALPWAASLWHQIFNHQSLNSWMGEWWTDRTLVLGPLYSVGVFTNGIAPYFRPPIPLPGIQSPNADVSTLLQFGTLLGLGAVLIGLISAFRRGAGPSDAKPSPGRTRELAVAASLFALVPLVGLLVTSWVLGPAYVLGRTDTFALPGFLIWIALGWTLAPRKLGLICLLSWIVLGLATTFGPDRSRVEKGSDRALAELIAKRAAPSEPIFVGLLGQPSLRYYAERLGFADQGRAVRGFPFIAERNPAAVFALPTDSLAVYLSEARALRQTAENAGVEAIWVTAHLHAPPPVWPRRPVGPPLERARRNANDLPYPASLLVYTFVGLDSVEVAAEYQQDWITGSRVLLRIPRSQWIDPDDLPPIEEQG